MAAFLIPKKNLVRFFSLILLCFAFYTLKLERTKPDIVLFCRHPANSVAYIKTHKTASSSVAHLFLRYANKYQRLLVYYKNPFNEDSNKFHRSSALGLKPAYNYSVFAQHTIFNYQEMRAVMPNDTKYITILRDPVSLVESGFIFANFELFFGINISAFANLNISNPEVAKLIKTRLFGKFGCNQMAFDLGIDPALFDSQNDILEKIQELDKQFDLVMITELFDESVILMKETLCWKDLNDVIGFKLKVRKAGTKARLSSEQKENVRRMNRADQLIYDHFYQKLLGQIDAFGKEKMKEEVGKLRAATREMYAVCVDEEGTLKENENMDEIESLKLKKEAENNEMCADLTGNYYQLKASIFSKQKSFFSENEIFLELIEIALGYVQQSNLFWRAFMSFLNRHQTIVSQLRNHFAFLSG